MISGPSSPDLVCTETSTALDILLWLATGERLLHHLLPLYISCVSAGSLSVFTALVSSSKEAIQLVNYIQLIHFEWIIHSPFFFLTFPWCLTVSSKFWNSQPVSGFSRRRCYPDSVWIVLSLFYLNVKFSLLCLFSFLPLLTSLMF